MEETKSQYLKVIESSRKVFKDKNLDYGSSWRILRVSSFVDQIHIKAQRIRNLQINEDQKIDEGQVPEFIGIINYCIMSLIQIQIGVVDEPDLNGTEVVELYDNKVNETFELMLKKNHDYGEAWRDMEISSLTDLIIQKIFRMKSINSNDGKTISSEGVESNFQDILNYSVFALILLKA
ncbi:MAG: hypothetical protein CMD00_01605 [Flavobacteriales bacterium]|nr:hypothetical protein [Flavobacteriales bacterium]